MIFLFASLRKKQRLTLLDDLDDLDNHDERKASSTCLLLAAFISRDSTRSQVRCQGSAVMIALVARRMRLIVLATATPCPTTTVR